MIRNAFLSHKNCGETRAEFQQLARGKPKRNWYSTGPVAQLTMCLTCLPRAPAAPTTAPDPTTASNPAAAGPPRARARTAPTRELRPC